MKWFKESGVFIILIVLGFWLTILSIFDVMYDKQWIFFILPVYALIVIFAFYLLFLRKKKQEIYAEPVEEFVETTAVLHHFKCPTCSGFFAIKKSKSNNKYIEMTCPDCGAIGVIPPNPECIEEEIPQKKSMKTYFKCGLCGEGLTVWAEGTDLYKQLQVYTCPYCGKVDTMSKV